MVEVSTIEKDFSFLSGRKDVLATLIYGSVVKSEETSRSDIDEELDRCWDKIIYQSQYLSVAAPLHISLFYSGTSQA